MSDRPRWWQSLWIVCAPLIGVLIARSNVAAWFRPSPAAFFVLGATSALILVAAFIGLRNGLRSARARQPIGTAFAEPRRKS